MCSGVGGAKGGAKGKAACSQIGLVENSIASWLGPSPVVIGAKVAVPGRTPGASSTKDDDEMEVHIGLTGVEIEVVLHVQAIHEQVDYVVASKIRSSQRCTTSSCALAWNCKGDTRSSCWK